MERALSPSNRNPSEPGDPVREGWADQPPLGLQGHLPRGSWRAETAPEEVP